jgi:hypothetical protein
MFSFGDRVLPPSGAAPPLVGGGAGPRPGGASLVPPPGRGQGGCVRQVARSGVRGPALHASVHSPLLGASRLFSIPLLTEMLQLRRWSCHSGTL